MLELSICIPTRNNYDTCKITISGILKDDQRGFELLIIDASDKPEILEEYVAGLDDERVRHVPVSAHDKREHWNKAIPECSGEWITFISDSDFADPKLVQIVRRMQAELDSIEAFGWNKVDYDWPEFRNEIRATKISLDAGAFKVDSDVMRKRFFGFEKEGLIPFSLYHGAVKRELIERIKDRFGGEYFEHPITSYESGYKVLSEAEGLAFIERPLTVLNAMSEDMLSEATVAKDYERKKSAFYDDIEIEDISGFPFASDLSPKLFGGIVLSWLADKYGSEFIIDGWQRNFVKCREDECNALYSSNQFAELSAAYKDAIVGWDGGKYAADFAPKFNENLISQKEIVGCFSGFLFLDKNAFGAKNPPEFYRALENFIPHAANLGIKIFDKNKRAA